MVKTNTWIRFCPNGYSYLFQNIRTWSLINFSKKEFIAPEFGILSTRTTKIREFIEQSLCTNSDTNDAMIYIHIPIPLFAIGDSEIGVTKVTTHRLHQLMRYHRMAHVMTDYTDYNSKPEKHFQKSHFPKNLPTIKLRQRLSRKCIVAVRHIWRNNRIWNVISWIVMSSVHCCSVLLIKFIII